MKTILIKLNPFKTAIILLFIVLFINCNQSKDTTKALTHDISPLSTLEDKFIFDLIKNYSNNQLSAINSNSAEFANQLNLSDGDTHSVRFDLDKLKTFIQQIEQKAEQNGIDVNDLGIRFHFAAYPDSINWSNYDDLAKFDFAENRANDYNYRTTLILIPTKKENNMDIDFNLLNNKPLIFDNNSFKSKSISESESKESNSTTTQVLSLNHGNAIPPIPR